MKPCKNCPFKRSSPLEGSPHWLKAVLTLNKETPYFNHSCHKTDPKADGYKGGLTVKECAGHVGMIMNKIDGTPGRNGLYNSIEEMAKGYLDHWQKELNRRQIENKNSSSGQ